MLFAAEQRIVAQTLCRVIEEVKACLETQDAAHGIVYTALAHLAFVYEFVQQLYAVAAVWVHEHIDAGIDGEAQGFFLVVCHFLSVKEIVDICPVSYEHSVPLQPFFQPASEQGLVSMHRHVVYASRIDHDGERTGFDACLVRSEVFLTQVLQRDDGWRAVFS